MNTAATLVQDLPELQDVMFALESQRVSNAAQASTQPSAPLLSAQQRRHVRADSRARAWIPAHLLDTLC